MNARLGNTIIEAFFISTNIVALAEIGDKTRFLAFIFAAKFRKPWSIILGILVVTLATRGLAEGLGSWLTSLMEPQTLRWVLGLSFIAMTIWTLTPDQFEKADAELARFGIFATTLMAFFVAEMMTKRRWQLLLPQSELPERRDKLGEIPRRRATGKTAK